MNAIILAAGMGTRLRPLTNEIPKCLVPVNGIPMVERQIQFLKEAGINDITLVSGYKASKLDFLKDKYGVRIILNDKFESVNNIYSMYLARYYFVGDTFCIDGDTFLNENCFLQRPLCSTYFARKMSSFNNEWELVIDDQYHLKEINVCSKENGGYIISGVSYWTKQDANLIVKRLEEAIKYRNYTNLFWDDIVIENVKSMNVKVQPFNQIFEIDTEKDLRTLEAMLNSKD